MLYFIIYFDENGNRTWIGSTSFEEAKKFSETVTNPMVVIDPMICVKISEYDEICKKLDRVKSSCEKFKDDIDAIIKLSERRQ